MESRVRRRPGSPTVGHDPATGRFMEGNSDGVGFGRPQGRQTIYNKTADGRLVINKDVYAVVMRSLMLVYNANSEVEATAAWAKANPELYNLVISGMLAMGTERTVPRELSEEERLALTSQGKGGPSVINYIVAAGAPPLASLVRQGQEVKVLEAEVLPASDAGGQVKLFDKRWEGDF